MWPLCLSLSSCHWGSSGCGIASPDIWNVKLLENWLLPLLTIHSFPFPPSPFPISLSPHPFLTSLSSPPFPFPISILTLPYFLSASPLHSFSSLLYICLSIPPFFLLTLYLPFHSTLFPSYFILFFTDFYWVLTHYTVHWVQLQYWELGRAGTRTPAASVEAWCNCLLSSWELDLLCWPSPSRGGHYAATESLLSGGI